MGDKHGFAPVRDIYEPAHDRFGFIDPNISSDPVQKSTYARGYSGVEGLISDIWQESSKHTPDRNLQADLIRRLPKTHKKGAIDSLAYQMATYHSYLKPSSTRYTKIITSTIGDDRGHMIQQRKVQMNLEKDQA